MEAKILIVEDALESWTLLSSMLLTHRYQPIWAADGIQALSEARKHQPHVILLDLGLPGGDGFVVLERLKNNRLLSAIPVIVVTARDPGVAEQKAREYGAAAFLHKPVKVDALIATIRGVLGQPAGAGENKDRMAELVTRKHQRFERSVPVRYQGTGIAGEGIINDLSLSGSSMTGNAPVSVGMVLTLHMFVPGDQEPLLIDRATVQWVKGSEFGVDFGTPLPEVAKRITQVISRLAKMQQDSSRQG